jgi:competence protein ComEC
MFYFATSGFALGVIIESLSTWGVVPGFFLLLIGVALLLGSRVVEPKRWCLVGGVILISLSVGVLRTSQSERRDYFLASNVSKSVILNGKVVSAPDKNPQGQRFILDPDSGHDRVLVTVATATRLYPGYRVSVEGEVSVPDNFDPNFDYVSYLAKDRVYYLMPQADLLSIEPRITLRGVMLRVREWFVGNLESYLPDPDAPLMAGVVLGDKSDLPESLNQVFRTVGLSHIIVLSGYNLTVVAEGIRQGLGFLPLKAALLGSGLGIILFALAAGGGASVARATVMALLVLWAKSTGRLYDVSRALLLAGVAMILINPKLLVFDAGFQLSFLATLGIIHGSEPIAKRLTYLPNRFGFRDLAGTTIAAQLAVLPWLIYLFSSVSLIALPTNLLVLPIVPILMFLGLILGGLGFIPLLLAPLALLTHWLVVGVIKFSELAASIPHASVVVSRPGVISLALWYLVYVTAYFILKR